MRPRRVDFLEVLQLCYPINVNSTTSSFRIPEELRLRLDLTARHLKRSKSWIINHALEEYLEKTGRDTLAAEARRQSLLVKHSITEDEKFWRKRADVAGWK